MRASTGGQLLLRQSRAHAGALAVVAAVVLVTCALGCAVPRVLSLVYDEGLRDALVAAGPTGRDLVATNRDFPPTGASSDPVSEYAEATQALRELAGPALSALVEETSYSLTTEPVPLTVSLEPDAEQRAFPATRLQLRAADRWQEQVRIVDGELPSGELGGACAVPRGEVVDATGCVVDVALAAVAAPDMELAVGDVVPVGAGGLLGQPFLLRVAGLFEPVDADADYWTRDIRALRPAQFFSDITGLNNEGIAFVHDDAWFFAQTRVGAETTAQVRLLTDPQANSSEDVPQLVDELRQLPEVTVSTGGQASTLRLRSLLDDVLQAHLAQRATAAAVMSVVLVGLMAVALAVLTLAARLVTERRRVSVRLAVARGASARQLAALQAAEGLLVAAPAAAAGSLLAAVLVGGRGGPASIGIPVLAVVATMLAVPLLGRGGRQGPGARGGRRDLWRRLASPVRVVVEASVCVVAVAALVSLRRRGLTTDADEAGTDLLLSAVPVLLAAAVGIGVLRLFPVPLSALASLTSRRPGAVAFLGLARSGREAAAAGAAPVLVLLLALMMAIFSSVISGTLVRGGVDASWQQVGADVRVGGGLYEAADVDAAAAVDGVASVAAAHVSYEAEVGRRTLAVVATDIDAYADVHRLDPVAPPLPPSLAAPVAAGEPLPAVVAADLADVGEELGIRIQGLDVRVDVVAVSPTLPGISTDVPWVLLPLDALRAVTGRSLVTGTAYVALDADLPRDADTLASLETTLTQALPTTASVTSRDRVADGLSESGLVSGVRGLFTAGVLAGAAYCALAVVLTLVVTSRQRDQVLSQLRTLGLSGRQARTLVALEVVPVATAALATGTVLGLTTPWLLGPAIDLRPFTGADTATPVTVDVAAVAGLAGGFVITVALAVLCVAAVNRRRVLGAVLRVGEDA